MARDIERQFQLRLIAWRAQVRHRVPIRDGLPRSDIGGKPRVRIHYHAAPACRRPDRAPCARR